MYIPPFVCSILREDRALSLPARTLARQLSPGPPIKPLPPSAVQPSWLQNVPVIVVGSHYDVLQKDKSQLEVDGILKEAQMLVNELQLQFWPYLKVIPDIIPLNCLMSKGEEMQKLKDQLDRIRRTRVQVCTVCVLCTYICVCTYECVSGHVSGCAMWVRTYVCMILMHVSAFLFFIFSFFFFSFSFLFCSTLKWCKPRVRRLLCSVQEIVQQRWYSGKMQRRLSLKQMACSQTTKSHSSYASFTVQGM